MRKCKTLIHCPKCNKKSYVLYETYKEQEGFERFWVFDYTIRGVECDHIHKGKTVHFREFIAKRKLYLQVKLF